MHYTERRYARIGAALDFGATDDSVLSHAIGIAKHSNASLCLFHIVEGVSGQLFGREADDEEARRDKERLERLAEEVRSHGIDVTVHLGFGSVPKQIVRLSTECGIDLLVMGGHRHRGLMDIIFGASISEVRHALAIPVLVVQ
jgi:manganese transport protein